MYVCRGFHAVRTPLRRYWEMTTRIPINVTVPIDLIEKLDTIRGDIPRSRLIERFIRECMNSLQNKQPIEGNFF